MAQHPITRNVRDAATLLACLYYFNSGNERGRFALFVTDPQAVFQCVWFHAACLDSTPQPVRIHARPYTLDFLAGVLELDRPGLQMFFSNIKPRECTHVRCFRCGKDEI